MFKKLKRNPIVMIAVGVIIGILAGEQLRPMLQKLPVVGKYFE